LFGFFRLGRLFSGSQQPAAFLSGLSPAQRRGVVPYRDLPAGQQRFERISPAA